MDLMRSASYQDETINNNILPPPLPRKMLRHLIFDHRIDLGTRCLVAGCGEGDLVRYLHMLGFDVVGLDDDLEKIETARNLSPHLRFEHWDTEDTNLAFDEQEFDLILVCGLKTFAHKFQSQESLATTAILMSYLKPSAPLVFISRQEYDQGKQTFGFPTSAFTELLSNFPGPLQTELFSDGPSSPWIFRFNQKVQNNGYLAVSVSAPRPQFSQDGWLKLAENGIRKQNIPATLNFTSQEVTERRAA